MTGSDQMGDREEIKMAWAMAPQALFDDDYDAFAEWAESTLAPLLVAALVAERAENERLRAEVEHWKQELFDTLDSEGLEVPDSLAAWRVARGGQQ